MLPMTKETPKEMLPIFMKNQFEKNIRKNGIILSDDVLGNDAFYDFTSEKKLENYLIKVKDDSGLGVIINH